MKVRLDRIYPWVVIALCSMPTPLTAAGTFSSANNLVVVRMSGPNTTSAAQAVNLNEYDVSGAMATLIQTVPIPSSGASALTIQGLNNHDGLLNRSIDGRYLTLAGYRADAGSADPSITPAASNPRVIARIDGGGHVDTSTALTNSYNLTTVRGAVSVDGSSFWVAGDNAGGNTTTGGLRYVPALGSSSSANLSQVQVTGGTPTPDNVRSIGIFDGQLFDSSGSSSSIGRGVFRAGSGLPTAGAQTLTPITTDNQSVNSFFFADLDASVPGLDTLYTAAGGLRKYSLVGGSWIAKGAITSGVAGIEAITGATIGSSVTIYATDGLTVQRLTDATGYNANLAGSFGTILTAGANESFRGLALAPVPEPSDAALVFLASFASFAGWATSRRRASRRQMD